MNANQLINMVVNTLIRTLTRRAVDAGIKTIGRGGRSAADTPENQAQSREARDLARKAQRAARITRRL